LIGSGGVARMRGLYPRLISTTPYRGQSAWDYVAINNLCNLRPTSMQELTPDNAAGYLLDRGLANPPVTVTALAWGVSNAVLLVEASGDRFVLKQSRAQLRTADPWFSRLDRIWRETGVLRLLGTLLPPGVVPAVRFEDRGNYLFTMDAAPGDHVVWKQLLLEGQADPAVARQLGEILGTIHRRTAVRPDLKEAWGDTEVFEQLRVDPFYRRVAEVHPGFRPSIEAMLAEMSATPVCLVLADFSPKNVLVHAEGLTLVDFETGHFGDPAFDLGFFLSHLLLKTVLHASRFDDYAALTGNFWETYWQALSVGPVPEPMQPERLFRRTLSHLAGCMLARVDGTSKVDYLTRPGATDVVRRLTQDLFLKPPADWAGVLACLREQVRP
jgi:5-methylthioribose kinase